jgi:Transposase DNA-binding/Transposase Tn5 dimerisation domain
MPSLWALDEMSGVDLHDKRLDERLKKIVSDLGEHPTLSIPAACGGSAEMTAAYRFFDNDKATFDAVLAPHRARTEQRSREQPVVLLVQDTSELDLTRPQQQVAGAGPLASGARRGLFLHMVEAFTPDGTPLGEVWSRTWARDDQASGVPPAVKRKQRKASPIEAKESVRWLEGMRQSRRFARRCPDTTCVCVADSEADVYELFAEPRGDTNPIHWLIRLSQDRALAAGPAAADAAPARLIRERLATAPVLFTKAIAVRGREAKIARDDRRRRQSRPGRRTVVEARAAAITLRPPRRPDRTLPERTANVVMVREAHPPADDEPVEWLLVTTLPIGDVGQVQTIVQYYTVRWMIEVLFRTLKSGCRVEERRFERADRVLVCLAVYLIVAWRTLYVCRLGRSSPDLDCEAVFEPSEWKSVWVAVHRGHPPEEPPRLAEMVRLIARLGGYVNHAGRTDPPGPQTVWLGLQRMHDLAWAWDTFGPGAQKRDV